MRRPLRTALLALLSLTAVPFAVRAQSPGTAAPAAQQTAASEALRPGDVVRLRIWREPDLSGDFPVDENGVVVFPKLGPITVASESPDALKEQLVRDYQVYLRNPSIDIIFLRRVNILGAVRNPGLYPLDPTMTVADAIALAGGALPQGKPDEVELVSGGVKTTAGISPSTKVSDLAIRSGDQLWVPERSWLSRNSNIVAASITATVSLLIALTR